LRDGGGPARPGRVAQLPPDGAADQLRRGAAAQHQDESGNQIGHVIELPADPPEQTPA